MSVLRRKLARDLRRMVGQVVTIALVVGAGIAAFVSMRGNHASLVEARDRYYERSRFADVFVHLERAPRVVRDELERLPGVARVEPRVKAGATLPLDGRTRPVSAVVISLPQGRQPSLNAVHLTSGRLVEAGRTDEVVLLDAFAEAHQLGPGDAIPAILDGVKRSLRVVGTGLSPEYVMALDPGSMTQDPKAFAVLWMGEDAVAAAYRLEGAFNDVSVDLRPGARLEATKDRIDRVLEPYGGLGAVARARQPSNLIIEGELLQLESMSTVVPGIFLAVAAMLLNVVLSRLVHLQRPQIATLKAVGYTDWEVGLHFFQLVSVVALLGAAIGLGLGTWMGSGLTALYAGYFKFPSLRFSLHLGSVVAALGISLGAAFAGAFFTVRRVMALPPAEAMRPPAPVRYRRSVIDVLGLAWLIGPSGHMILRELQRRPMRALGSSLAIAASVGLLVVAGWYRDGLDLLIDTQFHEVIREDVTVNLTDPRPARSLSGLRHLPGVLAAEGLRNVPVRFVSGHRHRDGSVIVYPTETTMRSPRDKFGVRRALPPTGVLLTRTLGRILAVEPGDPVTIEVREGERPSLRLPVAGLLDEGFGLQAHIRAEDWQRRAGEEPMISQVLLRVDPLEVGALERALKDVPRVAGVNRRADVLRQFEEQSGQMITVMIVLISLFGATITVGVVYNDARVALSLRARDLASLRVLGYRRREVSFILLGELAVQVLVALPLGLWFGRLLILGIASTLDAETYRLPVVLTSATYGYASLVALAAAALSALLVRRRLDRLDLIGVLKTRE